MRHNIVPCPPLVGVAESEARQVQYKGVQPHAACVENYSFAQVQ